MGLIDDATSWIGTIAVFFFNLPIQTWTKLRKAKLRQNRPSVKTILILNPWLLLAVLVWKYQMQNTSLKQFALGLH